MPIYGFATQEKEYLAFVHAANETEAERCIEELRPGIKTGHQTFLAESKSKLIALMVHAMMKKMGLSRIQAVAKMQKTGMLDVPYVNATKPKGRKGTRTQLRRRKNRSKHRRERLSFPEAPE